MAHSRVNPLDFPSRSVLAPVEISQRLGISLPHVHALLDEGELASINVASEGAKRKVPRIPIESFADFVACRSTGAHRFELLRQMPKAALEDLHRELGTILKSASRQ